MQGGYYVCRQADDRDLATFGINAVCFLFFESLTLFTIYPSHSVGKEWGTIACHATRHQALNSISVFNPVNGRERKEREGKRGKERNCAVATLIHVAVQANSAVTQN